MVVDVFRHRANELLAPVDMGFVNDARSVLPDAHVICFGRCEDGDNLLCVRQLRFVSRILLQLPHAIGDVLFREFVLRFHENDELFTIEADVDELMFPVRGSDKKPPVVLANAI